MWTAAIACTKVHHAVSQPLANHGKGVGWARAVNCEGCGGKVSMEGKWLTPLMNYPASCVLSVYLKEAQKQSSAVPIP